MPINKEAKEKICIIFDAMRDRIVYLYGRWQDEKEYEDWKDFVTEMKKEIEAISMEKDITLSVIGCNKRPFGITFSMPHESNAYLVRFKINSSSYSWTARIH